MERSFLTYQSIQKDLGAKINRKRSLAVFLTVFTLIGIFGVVWAALNPDVFVSQSFQNSRGEFGFLFPTIRLVFGGTILLLFVIFLWRYYYADLWKAKTGRFFVVEERLLEKRKGLFNYYRNHPEEYYLCFPCGAVWVEKVEFSFCSEGERFYVVCLNGSSKLRLAYSAERYALHEELLRKEKGR